MENDWVMKMALGSLAVVVVIFMAVMFILGYYAIDTMDVKPAAMVSVSVEEKTTVKARDVPVSIVANKVIVITTIRDPESYKVSFMVEGKHVQANVPEAVFNSITEGDNVQVTYGYGRLSGDVIPINVKKQ